MAWRKARFKGSEVLARCDAAGMLVSDGGRVEIRYRANDSRAYQAALRNLEPVEGGEILPDDACVEAKPAPARGGASNGRSQASKAHVPHAVAVAKPPPDGAILAYTDGACSGNPGPAGAGVVLIDGKVRRELSQYLGTGTNNIAELTAIELAVLGTPPDRPLRVHTDSQYSIGVLVRGWKAKANQELVARVRSLLATRTGVELVYVPGHAGVVLNERADALAVQAVQARDSMPWHEWGG